MPYLIISFFLNKALSSEKDIDSLNAQYFKKPNSEHFDNIR